MLPVKLLPAADVFREHKPMEVKPSSRKFAELISKTSESPLLGTETLHKHFHLRTFSQYCMHRFCGGECSSSIFLYIRRLEGKARQLVLVVHTPEHHGPGKYRSEGCSYALDHFTNIEAFTYKSSSPGQGRNVL